MRYNRFLIFLLFSLFVMESFTYSFQSGEPPDKIHWLSFQEAVEMNKKNPKKIFIDVYTDWCGWCKKMDATTFANPVIVKDMNKYFYAVKLNAEMKDTVVFSNVTFINSNPVKGPHQLAISLLKGQMGYPTTVYMNEKFIWLNPGPLEEAGPFPGYRSAEELEGILVFLGENHYQTEKYNDFLKNFKRELQ
jgi:thioredoxin-related protein